MLNQEKISELAAQLRTSEITVKPIAPLSKQYQLTEEDAYEIQKINIKAKLESGEEIVGKKIGLTSKPMQEMFGVDTPDFGYLLKGMYSENGTFLSSDLLQPRVEAEIAFKLQKDLMGPNISVEDVIAATEYVVASFEIVDSRIANWQIGISDTIADNASSGRYTLGNITLSPKQVDLKNIKMSLYKNDEFANAGLGSAALGDPAYCVAWLGNKLAAYNVALKKGEIILSGALSAALPAQKGDVFRAEFSELGTITAIFI
jgi:2-keto-4-pentenoate hydratase